MRYQVCTFVADINSNMRALNFALSHPLVFSDSSVQATRRKPLQPPTHRVRCCGGAGNGQGIAVMALTKGPLHQHRSTLNPGQI